MTAGVRAAARAGWPAVVIAAWAISGGGGAHAAAPAPRCSLRRTSTTHVSGVLARRAALERRGAGRFSGALVITIATVDGRPAGGRGRYRLRAAPVRLGPGLAPRRLPAGTRVRLAVATTVRITGCRARRRTVTSSVTRAALEAAPASAPPPPPPPPHRPSSPLDALLAQFRCLLRPGC